MEDPIVDAAEIGNKTAEKLVAIGIKTISDLLNQKAEDIAKKIE
ncbi:MAG: DUF4332 domain-containing protein [Promethearchaeota archaeon]